MVYTEQDVCWIFTSTALHSDWSQGGHKTGQLVSETPYLVTNL
ncbi:MAG: hypothetical protein AM325_008360 [Candidatus Thorarchaeota archaeon SMTZ1-45]